MSFVFEPRYETVTYPDKEDARPGWVGFQIRIVCNPSGANLRTTKQLFREYQKLNTIETEDAFFRHIAPRIVEWNLEKRQEDGSTIVYPPPAEQWDVVYELEESVFVWLGVQAMIVHLPKPKVLTADQDLPIDVSTTDSTPPTQIRPKNSSKRSSSTLTA